MRAKKHRSENRKKIEFQKKARFNVFIFFFFKKSLYKYFAVANAVFKFLIG